MISYTYFQWKKHFYIGNLKKKIPLSELSEYIAMQKKMIRYFFIHECYINQEKKYFIDYWGYDSNIKMGADGNYYITLENFSQCDMNSEVNFSLIKIK